MNRCCNYSKLYGHVIIEFFMVDFNNINMENIRFQQDGPTHFHTNRTIFKENVMVARLFKKMISGHT